MAAPEAPPPYEFAVQGQQPYPHPQGTYPQQGSYPQPQGPYPQQGACPHQGGYFPYPQQQGASQQPHGYDAPQGIACQAKFEQPPPYQEQPTTIQPGYPSQLFYVTQPGCPPQQGNPQIQGYAQPSNTALSQHLPPVYRESTSENDDTQILVDEPPIDYSVLQILARVAFYCFFPIGLVARCYLCASVDAAEVGDLEKAHKFAKRAKGLSIAAINIGCLLIVGFGITFGVLNSGVR